MHRQPATPPERAEMNPQIVGALGGLQAVVMANPAAWDWVPSARRPGPSGEWIRTGCWRQPWMFTPTAASLPGHDPVSTSLSLHICRGEWLLLCTTWTWVCEEQSIDRSWAAWVHHYWGPSVAPPTTCFESWNFGPEFALKPGVKAGGLTHCDGLTFHFHILS